MFYPLLCHFPLTFVISPFLKLKLANCLCILLCFSNNQLLDLLVLLFSVFQVIIYNLIFISFLLLSFSYFFPSFPFWLLNSFILMFLFLLHQVFKAISFPVITALVVSQRFYVMFSLLLFSRNSEILFFYFPFNPIGV